jgi:hypothetical protein
VYLVEWWFWFTSSSDLRIAGSKRSSCIEYSSDMRRVCNRSERNLRAARNNSTRLSPLTLAERKKMEYIVGICRMRIDLQSIDISTCPKQLILP